MKDLFPRVRATQHASVKFSKTTISQTVSNLFSIFDVKRTKLSFRKFNEIRLKYTPIVSITDLPKVTSSKVANEMILDYIVSTYDKDTIYLKEYFGVLFLNNSNRVIGHHRISEGGITGTLVDVRLLFAAAINSLGVAMILYHNHPSGVLKPSKADKILTKKIQRGAETLDIKLLDHIIVTGDKNAYYSFADENLI